MCRKLKIVEKKEQFNDDSFLKQLQYLEETIDWNELVAVIFPHYIKSTINAVLPTVENMLRINILLRYFQLSPSEIHKALIKNAILRDFTLIDVNFSGVPSVTSISEFSGILQDKDISLLITQAMKPELSKPVLNSNKLKHETNIIYDKL